MTEEIKFIRCTCDICKKKFDIETRADNPLHTVWLPIKCFSESGTYEKVSVTRVEVCEACLIEMQINLSQNYKMKHTLRSGLEISKY